MVVLEEFYQITEARPKDVSYKWKLSHVAVFAFTAIFSFAASFSCGELLSHFLYNCIIDSYIIFSTTETIPVRGRNISAIDLTFSSWGHSEICNFVQFTPLSSMIASIIWGCFFIIMGKGGSGYANDNIQSPWKIIYPCIIFSIFMIVTFLASTIIMSVGLHNFCNTLNTQFENATGCSSDIDYFTLQFCETKQNFFYASRSLEIGNYIAIVGWILQLVILILRICCITDYKIHLVRIIEEEAFTLFATTDNDLESETQSVFLSEIQRDADDSL